MSLHPVAFPVSTKKPDLAGVRVALACMPWRLPRLPAIGLASIKAAALEAGVGGCDVLYLNDRWFRFLLEHGRYSQELRSKSYSEFSRVISDLSRVILAAEWMFSSAVFGGYVCTPQEYAAIFSKEAADHPYARFCDDVMGNAHLAQAFIDECVSQTDWSRYDLIGFSCVFDQLMPSLALARKLRSTGFAGKLVLGGPLCEGSVGKHILELFDFVDAVFDGESELSFPAYLAQLVRPTGAKAPGVWQRAPDGAVFKAQGRSAVREMDALPVPVYTDYFDEIDRHGLMKREDVPFPVEASRGCWWGEHHHCVFCGLNGSDMAYRSKSPERVDREIRAQYAAYGLSYVSFTDNIVSPKFMRPLIGKLEKEPLPIKFFIETKSNLSRRQVKEYKRVGIEAIQPGIESLSSHVLELMDKGVNALGNVACLKYCKEAGVRPYWNLLYGFPGERREDYEQIRSFLLAMVHLDPPEGTGAMRLTRFSPSYTNSEALGFHDRRPASYHRLIYPYPDDVIAELVNTFDFSFRDDLDRDALVRPIDDFIAVWKRYPKAGTLVLTDDRSGVPTLYDSRFNRVLDSKALTPLEKVVYEFCDVPRGFADIACAAAEHDPGVTHAQVRVLLESFVADRFMLTEADAWLSLALHDAEFIPWYDRALAERWRLYEEGKGPRPTW